jgi:hypothetical protein
MGGKIQATKLVPGGPTLPVEPPATISPDAPAEPETVYNREDLLAAARSGFGVFPEVMAGALRFASLEGGATRQQAQAAVTEFLKRKV